MDLFSSLPFRHSTRACVRANADARSLSHTKPTKLATITQEVI